MGSAAVHINERKRKSSTKRKVRKYKGKTFMKRKSITAFTSDLEEDFVYQSKVEVYYIRKPQNYFSICRPLYCQPILQIAW